MINYFLLLLWLLVSVDHKEYLDTLSQQQNDVDPIQVYGIQWLLNLKHLGKATSMFLVSLLDRHLSLEIKRAVICYKSLNIKGKNYLEGPKKCYNCLVVGHLSQKANVF
ncbi:hypothetical protein VP01_637g1 [Puccinia sorghi]|uniref:Uncharacterized protein n=1 Tax=Puccinia sorghi TaxID=27349 RepID=A0A0L6UFY2_9BASI|nr:hypothetical protein VP01_637g1 [Puccinia sorghi]